MGYWTTQHNKGTLAEWLRRSPAKAVCYACESSNLSGVEIFFSSGKKASSGSFTFELESNNGQHTQQYFDFD